MAKKLETIKLIASLEKAAKKTESPLWADLAERLSGPSRNRVAVNVKKLSEMAEKNKGKTLLVPGKVLSFGEFTQKATVVAVSVSAQAKAKINEKGEFVSLKEYADKAEKGKAKEVLIVK